ncbi:MAG: cysteine desulfurase NifS [Syntrophorhabdaceae bacterium]|nr:cysteine desulfurase NifS [Syntrophorhabdaceae bacterium]
MKLIYLDNNATTMVAPEVLEEMLPYFSKQYGNPSSIYSFGANVSKKIEEAREKVADLLGAERDEIIFTSCGTEGDNAAIMSALSINPEKKHIVTTKVEHPAVKVLCESLETKGYRITRLSVKSDGSLDLDEYRDSLTPDTAIVSIMWANNETGVLFPVEELAEIAKERDILFHTDAVQAAGKIPINMKKNHIDMLSISGHKIHAPKGVGALYIRQGTMFSPFLIGGHQEGGRRAGTENVTSIIGLGKACELAKLNLEKENTHVKALRDYLENGLLKNITNCRINGNRNNRIPNTTNMSFEFVEGESILLLLDQYGICASSGSACTSGSTAPSHVLDAMGVPNTMIHGSIRFSLSVYNTQDEIDYVIDVMPKIIDKLRQMSPYWREEKKICAQV